MTDEHDVKNQEPQAAVADVIKTVGHITKWKDYLIYVLIALMVLEGGVIVWQRGSVAKAEKAVVEKDRQLDAMKVARDLAIGNEQTCRLNIADQNAKIADASKRYTELQGEMVELAKKIAKGDYYKPADNVRNQEIPKTCEETLDFMNRNLP